MYTLPKNSRSLRWSERSFRPLLTVGLVLAGMGLSGLNTASASGTLGVSELTRETLSRHPSLRVAQAREDVAQSAVDAAQWQFWPTPRVGLERVENTGGGSSSGGATVGILSLQQPIWTGGRLTAGLKRAESNVLRSTAETQEARVLLAERVIQSWSEAVVALRKIEAQKLSLQRHERLLEMVDRRLAEGASAQADASLAKSRIEVLQSDIMLLNAQRDAALDKLRSLTGRSLSAKDLVLSHQKPVVVNQTLETLVQMAIGVSPQIQKAEYLVEVAKADVDSAKAALMPEVVLRYEHRYSSDPTESAAAANRLYLTLNTNLGAGLSGFTGVNTAAAELSAAQQEIDQQKEALTERVQADFTLVQAAQARLKGLTFAANAAAEVLDSYERQFLAGRKQWLDLMNAAREQAQSESQLADALGALELSSLRLVLWTGGVDALVQVRAQNAR